MSVRGFQSFCFHSKYYDNYIYIFEFNVFRASPSVLSAQTELGSIIKSAESDLGSRITEFGDKRSNITSGYVIM